MTLHICKYFFNDYNFNAPQHNQWFRSPLCLTSSFHVCTFSLRASISRRHSSLIFVSLLICPSLVSVQFTFTVVVSNAPYCITYWLPHALFSLSSNSSQSSLVSAAHVTTHNLLLQLKFSSVSLPTFLCLINLQYLQHAFLPVRILQSTCVSSVNIHYLHVFQKESLFSSSQVKCIILNIITVWLA